MGIQQAAVLLHGFRQNLINPLNAELNPICQLLTLLGAHRIFHVNRIRVKLKNSLAEDIHVHRQYDAHRHKCRNGTRKYKKTLNSTSKRFLYGVRFHEDQNLPGYDAVSILNLLPTFRRGFFESNFIA